MSRRLPTRWSSRSAPVLDALQQLGLVLLGPGDVVGAQGGDGGLDGGQRRAQVVADGGQQRGTDPVALGEPPGLARPRPTSRCRSRTTAACAANAAEHPAVLGGQHPAGQGERHVVADRHVDVRVLGPQRRAAGPTLPAQVHGSTSLCPLQQGHGLHARRSRGPAPAGRPGWSRRAARCPPGRRGSRTRRAAGRPGGCGGRRGPPRRPPRRRPPTKITMATMFLGSATVSGAAGGVKK